MYTLHITSYNNTTRPMVLQCQAPLSTTFTFQILHPQGISSRGFITFKFQILTEKFLLNMKHVVKIVCVYT